jgi:hypothetical protein
MNDYSDDLDSLDASVFNGEILVTHLDEFQDYLTRWQKQIDDHKANREVDVLEENE